jgi:hypothetical protein
MRQALLIECALLIFICIAASPQPVFAQANGQIGGGKCRHAPCGEATPPPCGDKKRGLIYISPPSGRSELHQDPSTGSPVVKFSPPYGSRVLYTDAKKDAGGACWYYINVSGLPPGWTNQTSSSPPPPPPPGRPVTLDSLHLEGAHPIATMTMAGAG